MSFSEEDPLSVRSNKRRRRNASGQMITTYHDPDAILDNPLAKGGDDTVYYADSEAVPRPGTPVVVRIEAAAKPGPRKDKRPSGH